VVVGRFSIGGLQIVQIQITENEKVDARRTGEDIFSVSFQGSLNLSPMSTLSTFRNTFEIAMRTNVVAQLIRNPNVRRITSLSSRLFGFSFGGTSLSILYKKQKTKRLEIQSQV